jgi:prepilin-type N-terminal cleavage/methylation domain-containing protein
MTKRSTKATSGMTLVELLVALSVGSALFTLVLFLFSASSGHDINPCDMPWGASDRRCTGYYVHGGPGGASYQR